MIDPSEVTRQKLITDWKRFAQADPEKANPIDFALFVLQKYAIQPISNIRYGIGNSTDRENFAMKYGPVTTKHECLSMVGDTNDYIIKFKGGYQFLMYEWSDVKCKWVRTKKP